MPSILAVIPARYGSTRFPGKPLAILSGKPMVVWVLEQARKVSEIDRIVVATDDERIFNTVTQSGAEALMTRSDHPSGTDRIWEVVCALPEYDWILNLQGDEPFINSAALELLISGMLSREMGPLGAIGTLQAPLVTWEEAKDENIVKAVSSPDGLAYYFSRQLIPYQGEASSPLGFRHLGVYLYHRRALELFTQASVTPLEKQERLEQLRALALGIPIYMHTIAKASIGIDTPEDLIRAEHALLAKP